MINNKEIEDTDIVFDFSMYENDLRFIKNRSIFPHIPFLKKKIKKFHQVEIEKGKE